MSNNFAGKDYLLQKPRDCIVQLTNGDTLKITETTGVYAGESWLSIFSGNDGTEEETLIRASQVLFTSWKVDSELL